ncbi:hypothetical protein ApAK_03885 [Thermoplasmatales archaeon AK]|nr:hypothetical protein [Thermoplasmatales archaeon AK]
MQQAWGGNADHRRIGFGKTAAAATNALFYDSKRLALPGAKSMPLFATAPQRRRRKRRIIFFYINKRLNILNDFIIHADGNPPEDH